jgi:hypothetical protein
MPFTNGEMRVGSDTETNTCVTINVQIVRHKLGRRYCRIKRGKSQIGERIRERVKRIRYAEAGRFGWSRLHPSPPGLRTVEIVAQLISGRYSSYLLTALRSGELLPAASRTRTWTLLVPVGSTTED